MTELIWISGIVLLLLLVYNAFIHPRLMKMRKIKQLEKKLTENDEYKDLLIAMCKAVEKELRQAGEAVDDIKKTYNLMGTKTTLQLGQKAIQIVFELENEELLFVNGQWMVKRTDGLHLDIPFTHYEADFYHEAATLFRLLPLWCQASNTHHFLPDEEAKKKRNQIEEKLFNEVQFFIHSLATRYEPSPLLNVKVQPERNSV
ncbi:hypothetical protein EH196_19095 [Bacillus sp. C1-1]|nr:hypothetical protein EH196_19095 [Bacillus sp. C1-1]